MSTDIYVRFGISDFQVYNSRTYPTKQSPIKNTPAKDKAKCRKKFIDRIYFLMVLQNIKQIAIECGAHPPNERLIKLITAQFSANETWMRTGEGDMFCEPLGDKRAARFLSLFDSLLPHYQDIVLGVIDVLYKMRGKP
jgi:hypothetical protein